MEAFRSARHSAGFVQGPPNAFTLHPRLSGISPLKWSLSSPADGRAIVSSASRPNLHAVRRSSSRSRQWIMASSESDVDRADAGGSRRQSLQKCREVVIMCAVAATMQVFGWDGSTEQTGCQMGVQPAEAISLPSFLQGSGGEKATKATESNSSKVPQTETIAPSSSSTLASLSSSKDLSVALKQSGDKNAKLVENAAIDPLDEHCVNVQVDSTKFVRLTNAEQRTLLDSLLSTAQTRFKLTKVVVSGKRGEFLARAGTQITFSDGQVQSEAQITALKRALERAERQSSELKLDLESGQEEVAVSREKLLEARMQMDREISAREAENAKLTQVIKVIEAKLAGQPDLKSIELAYRAKEVENRRLQELTEDQMEAFESAKLKTQQAEEQLKSLASERAKIEKAAADRVAAAEAQLDKQIAENRASDAARIKELEMQVLATRQEAAKETESKLAALRKDFDAALLDVRNRLGDSEKIRADMASAATKTAAKTEQVMAELKAKSSAALETEKKASEERLKKALGEAEKKTTSLVEGVKKSMDVQAKKFEARLKEKDVALETAVKNTQQNADKTTAAKLADLQKKDQDVITSLKKELGEAERAAEKRTAARFDQLQKESQAAIADLKKQLANAERSNASALAAAQKTYEKQVAAKDQELNAKLAQAEKDKVAELKKSAADFRKQLKEQQQIVSDTERARADATRKYEASLRRIEALEKKLADKQ